ncbi:dimethyl sulfoxide reductase anchor subunit family protein [Rahnella aceris]|uniref:dimethyl sulfoxide reductase anchor subunit family protein n=1 Tax=Rahnella sp. (strain Y9602) TaxID=2703885 RepID=UPI001C277337|nr:DmsC/YnfH family molybdoenzyme membrane anchor subunit [Rahnella aceris]MBU9852331.1 dimethyl sulfoxide reductase anchor subunit [Rahnella aceris]
MQEWPLIVFTLLIQLSVGSTLFTTFILMYAADSLNTQEKWRVAVPAMLLAFVAGALGLVASTAHLGYPLNAFHALSHISSSWLSREIVFASLYLGILGLTTLIGLVAKRVATSLMLLASVLGLIDLFCMSAIYVHASVATWMHINTYVMFYATALSLGAITALWRLSRCPWLPWKQARRISVICGGALIVVTLARLLEQPIYLESLNGVSRDAVTFPHQPLMAFAQSGRLRLMAWVILTVGTIITACSLQTHRIGRLLLVTGGTAVLLAEIMLRFNFFSIH